METPGPGNGFPVPSPAMAIPLSAMVDAAMMRTRASTIKSLS